MGRTVDGVSSILDAARVICRNYSRFGAAGLITRTTPEFAVAVGAFVLACEALMLVDDQPAVIDREEPLGDEDIPLV